MWHYKGGCWTFYLFDWEVIAIEADPNDPNHCTLYGADRVLEFYFK